MKIPCHALNSVMYPAAAVAFARQKARQYFGRRKGKQRPLSACLDKGIRLEEEAIALVSRLIGQDISLCTEYRENHWLIGRCDILTKDTVIDIKVCWDKLQNRTYLWQLQGYMWLYDRPKACTISVLLDDPQNGQRFGLDDNERILIGNVCERSREKQQQIQTRAEYINTLYQNRIKEIKTMKDYSLNALNGHIHDQLERLMNPDLDEDDLKKEVMRSKAVEGLAQQSVAIAHAYIEAGKMQSLHEIKLPEMLNG